MPEAEAKPQLHVSYLDTLAKCGKQFQYRYGARFGCYHEEIISPPGIALTIGTAVHKSVETNLRGKMEKRKVTIEEATQAARDSLTQSFDEEYSLTVDENLNIKDTVARATDMGIALSKLHYTKIAPDINPVAVEEKFVIELEGYPYDLSGQLDIREALGLRDTKTAGKSPSPQAADSLQMSMYSLHHLVKYDKYPEYVALDFLVKTKTPKAVTVKHKPDKKGTKRLMARVENATKIIEGVKEGKGDFTPADPEHWICTKKFCGYTNICPFYSGR